MIDKMLKARAKTISEAELQRSVIDAAHLFGYLVAHFRPAWTGKGYRTAVGADGKGWPDLTFARPGRFFVAELKSMTGRMSCDQVMWRAQLREAGVEFHTWTPMEWLDGTIEAVLA